MIFAIFDGPGKDIAVSALTSIGLKLILKRFKGIIGHDGTNKPLCLK